ncbi:DedA family protein [Candidatus Sumerlaeota bacterium]|nr:DedA family protein [Candidatus Sumerlaeota bacterium]
METVSYLFDLFMHIDVHLGEIIRAYGVWTMALLFIIIFCETGLVVTPFLPGDSLLFAVGIFAGKGDFNVAVVLLILCVAAILGDACNYSIGKYLGPAFVEKNRGRLLKKEHLDATHRYFDKYGKKTIVIARFVPVIRTLAPFMAGVGKMTYLDFAHYNVVGGILWVNVFLWGGYLFGELPFVKNNFTYVVLGIIAISCLPIVYEVVKHWNEKRKNSNS